MPRESALERLTPRAVSGQREYHITLSAKRSVAEAAQTQARREFITLGARSVFEDQAGTAFVLGNAGNELPLFLSLQTADGQGTLTLRARPDELDYLNYWPPENVRRIAAMLAQAHDLHVGETRMTAKPTRVTPTTIKTFVDEVLLSRTRAAPIVVLTPGRFGTPELAAQVALDLAGVANVYYFEDAEFAKQFAYGIGRERGVFGGAVRIYRPGFTRDSDPLDHDLMVPSYLDRRLSVRGSLSEELARRILPSAGEPISRPRAAPAAPAPLVLPEIVHKPTATDRARSLQDRLVQVEQENEELAEENRRLNAALRKQADRLRQLEGAVSAAKPSVKVSVVPALPWSLENPDGHAIDLGDRFADDIATVARDGSLAKDVRKKMESVLRHPADYGKDMRGPRHGQRCCYVGNNYRLVWSVDGRKVRFVLIVSKEDPEYSPHGA